MDLTTVYTWVGILVGVGAITSSGFGFLRWSSERLGERIMTEIRTSTYPISPGANGGLSLPDVARRVAGIERDLAELRGQVDLLVRIYTEEDGN